MSDPTWQLHQGAVPGALAILADDSVDACVTDPPYELGHVFQVLTKRPERMREFMGSVMSWATRMLGHHRLTWPPPHIWLGVSVEDQPTADERIPLLLETPAAVRFISAEPLLGPVNVRPYVGAECIHEDATVEPDTNATVCSKCDESALLDWVVVGGESGPGARPMELLWLKSIINACTYSGTRLFVKQLGDRPVIDGAPFDVAGSKGGDPAAWPAAFRFREFPREVEN